MATSKPIAWSEYRPQAFKLFVLSASIVHLWTIFNMFYDMPSWVLRMELWELLGSIGYTLAFALIESALVATPFIAIGLLLPSTWRARNLLSISAIVLLTSTLLAFALHYTDRLQNYEKLLALIWLAANLGLGFMAIRFQRMKSVVEQIADRLALLVYTFLAADVLGILIILVRNL